MSRICIINNALEQQDQHIVESECALKTYLRYKAKHPQAKIFKGNPCLENDVTPTRDNKASIHYLIESNEDFTIVLYPGEIITAVNWAFAKLFGAAVSAFVKIPKMNDQNSASGSSNNSLSNPENKQRIGQRVPYILGGPKAIPDLFAPAYRYFKDDIEVEEMLLCVCENPVQLSNFKEGDTPVKEISGKSITAYGLNQSLVGAENIYKIGDTFDQAPIIAKQINSVNGQTLLPPNGTRVERNDLYFQYPNLIKCLDNPGDFDKFVVNETIIIEGANFGIADLAITGQVTIDHTENTLSITSTQTVANFEAFRKINITAMLITDPTNGQLDLAGLYDVESITRANDIYTIKLLNPSSTNTNFANLTAVATTNISANLTANTSNIYLDGTYTVTGIDKANKQIALATPNNVNSDWDKLYELTGQQTPRANLVRLRGSQDNYIGWFTLDSSYSKGLLLNFRAGSGVYQGWDAKTVTIDVEYQQVVNDVPTGTIYTETLNLTGKSNNRDAIGGSMWIELPFSGAVRFRARRTNDNGDAADLVDEVKFYLAYGYHKLEKLVYSNRVLVRQRTVATANATSQDSRQLNCIAESLVYSYRNGVKSAERVPSRNIADLTIDLALHPKIGRRTEAEIDFDRIYNTVDEIEQYFGSTKMTEFNYTLDNTNQSFEEIMRLMSAATCTHDRRVNRKIYYDLESADNVPLILFNHRNKFAGTETREFNFVVENRYDGIEITYVDSEADWIEKTLKIPNEMINNPKKIQGTGIIYKQQAHVVGWREWNKLKFNRISTKFTAACESDLVFRGDCILTTDDTRTGNCTSGEIESWSGLDIQVSQPFQLDPAKQYFIHLQLKTGQLDVMKITQNVDEYSFKLERPPLENLVTTGQVKTMYSVTTDDRQDELKFLVAKKTPKDIFENEVLAINFDERYYRNDKDILNNLI